MKIIPAKVIKSCRSCSHCGGNVSRGYYCSHWGSPIPCEIEDIDEITSWCPLKDYQEPQVDKPVNPYKSTKKRYIKNSHVLSQDGLIYRTIKEQ
jgi:hypothetical protein